MILKISCRLPVSSCRVLFERFVGLHNSCVFPNIDQKSMKETSYRDLEVYQESRRLALEVHAISLQLPKFELYEEGSRVRRSSKASDVCNC
jgi:hypothetical protein